MLLFPQDGAGKPVAPHGIGEQLGFQAHGVAIGPLPAASALAGIQAVGGINLYSGHLRVHGHFNTAFGTIQGRCIFCPGEDEVMVVALAPADIRDPKNYNYMEGESL